MSFEKELKNLERIAENLEKGNIPLEKAAELYSDGIKAAAECRKLLDEAKLKIKVKE